MKNLRNRIHTGRAASAILAVLFAVLCTGAHHAELLHAEWKATVDAPTPVTVRLPVNYFRITMLRNEFIYSPQATESCPDMIPRGATVAAETECGGLLTAYEEGRRPLRPLRVVAVFALYLFIGLLLSAYMRREDMGRARWLRSQVGLFLLMGTFAIAAKAILLFTSLSFTVLPMAAIPMLAAMFLGRRLSFGVALATALMVSALLNFNAQVLFYFLATGLSSVQAAAHRGRIWILIKAGFATAFVALAATLFTTLLLSGTIDIYDDIREHFNPATSVWIASLAGGLASGLLAILLLPLAVVVVGEISRNRLLDLQDLDNPLLKRLRERAPSTWEHSRAMANLAEAASHAIGANSMLVRVGAYYHDVGKSSQPAFFIENQRDGENPHNALTPVDSAHAIFQHVLEGTRLLRMAGVPEDVVEFVFTHHGTSMLEYFWIKNQQNGNPQHLTEADFCYPGNIPGTRETAILMIVDAAEAAARTVENPDKPAFEALVQRIVFAKLNQGQFDESGLSLHELRIIIATIVDSLVSMYHSRIKYPWQTQTGGLKAADSTSIVPTTPSAPPAPELPPEELPVRDSRPPAPVARAPFPPASDIETDANPERRDNASRSAPRDRTPPVSDTYTGPMPRDPGAGRKTPV